VAVNWVELMKLVGTATALFQMTVEFVANPEPLTVSVKAEPAGTVAGLRLEIVGVSVGDIKVIVAPLDAKPPVLTPTDAIPGDAMRFAAMVAVNWVELMKLVGTATALFQMTVEFVANPEPLTMSAKAEPAGTIAGLRLEIVGIVWIIGVVFLIGKIYLPGTPLFWLPATRLRTAPSA
jgi:hypothetical protein